MKIVIIGAGFSGTTLAARLLRENKGLPIDITLIEKDPFIGKGAAYSTEKTFHLLNVKSEKMSAFPEDSGHFDRWLGNSNITISKSGHMSRKLYGKYVEEILLTELKDKNNDHRFELINDEVTDISFVESKALLLLHSGEHIEADKVVLAVGNSIPPSLPYSLPEAIHCNDPWKCNRLDQLPDEHSILIVGSGLTMVDICVSLFNKNHKGKIISISQHGYLPAAHHYTKSYPDFKDDLKNISSTLQLLKVIRRHLNIAKETGYDWRSVIDALRPYTNQLWQGLPDPEKQKFLKRLNRIWNISRHRIPPEYNIIIQKMIINQNLEIRSGRIKSIVYSNDQIEVTYKEKGAQDVTQFNVDFVINCTGPQTNYSRINEPLIKNLLQKKVIEPGNLSMGIKAKENGAVYVQGRPSSILYTLGPPLLGTLFETTAVPELREQVKNLSELIVEDLISKNMVVNKK